MSGHSDAWWFERNGQSMLWGCIWDRGQGWFAHNYKVSNLTLHINYVRVHYSSHNRLSFLNTFHVVSFLN